MNFSVPHMIPAIANAIVRTHARPGTALVLPPVLAEGLRQELRDFPEALGTVVKSASTEKPLPNVIVDIYGVHIVEDMRFPAFVPEHNGKWVRSE